MRTWLTARTLRCLLHWHGRCHGAVMGRCPHNRKMVFVDCGCVCHSEGAS